MLFNAALFAIAVSANLLKNGDFEDHSAQYCKESWCILTDEKAIAPWKVCHGTQFEVDHSPWPNQSGQWSMDLSANTPYGIEQEVHLVPGEKYVLSFYLNANYLCDPKEKTGYVSATGVAPLNFKYNHDTAKGAWTEI
ncbi:hypothetical protein HK103_002475, partial [Boothiomyces macroporosus]